MAGTIICYGDSNTFGYDSRMGTEGRFPKEIRWTGILDDRTEYKGKQTGRSRIMESAEDVFRR